MLQHYNLLLAMKLAFGLQHDIQAGKAALKKVAASKPTPRVAEPSLEAKLRQGIAKLRFDDTAGPPAAEDDISNNFSP